MHVNADSTQLAALAELDDLSLVHASKKGDVSAFEELVKRHDVKLLRIACHVTQNREDAEEAVQDAFLNAYMKLDQFEEKSSFSTWITRIVLNESLGKLRKQRARNDHSIPFAHTDDDVPLDIADWAPNPEQLYSATELRATLIKCLEALRPALRIVFVLRDVAGLSGDETAEILGLKLQAVKARLFRARLQLREKLTKHFKKPAVPRPVTDRPKAPQPAGDATEISKANPALAPGKKPGVLSLLQSNDRDPMWSAMYELLTER